MKLRKWEYLIAMCFFLGEILINPATYIQLWLYFKALRNSSGAGRSISKVNNISFIILIKGITSHIAWINAIYSAYVILKAIYVCNLLHHNTEHPSYMIIYRTQHDIICIIRICMGLSTRKVDIYITSNAFY